LAYYSAKDISAFTYNSTDLKAFVMEIGGLEIEEIVTRWRAPGSVSKTTALTGQFDPADVEVKFILDGTATGPAVKCALSTSATLTVGLGTNISITGTAKVVKWVLGIPEDGHDTFTVTFAWDGAATWDLNAAS
jgi:hypothetical protein